MVHASSLRRGRWTSLVQLPICLALLLPGVVTAQERPLILPHGEFPAFLQEELKSGSAKVATANQLLYDVQHYTLYLMPDFDQESIAGLVIVDFVSLADGLNLIELDLFQSLQALGATDGSGTALSFTHENDLLGVVLDTPLAMGEAARIQINYQGSPQPAGFMGLQFLEHDGTPILASLSEPYYSRSWWPCKDIASDKATSTMNIRVPSDFFCASNGVLTQITPQSDGSSVYTYETNYPISAYNISLAVTNYVGWTEIWNSPSGKDMEIEYWVFPEDLAAAQVDFANTRAILDLYSELFGEYPFVDEKYGMAEFVFQGAMEHQTMTSYGQALLTGDGFFERLVAHELAHQWFGNLVTVQDWDELGLHEGFATYAEAIWIEHNEGASARQTYMRQTSAAGIGFWGPVSPPSPLFGDTVYQKGGWVLHMLRKVVGENDFYQILKDYAASPELRYGSARISDFIQIAESVSGSELDWFFDQWIYRVGRPDYQISWRSEPAGERFRVILTILQNQAGESYRMPLEFFVDSLNGSESFVIWNDGPYQVASVLVDAEPVDLRFDPGDWILRWNQYPDVATSSPTPRMQPLTLLPNVPNPFNPSTRLRFRTPGSVPVQLRILDLRGRLVRSEALGILPVGEHEWTWRGRDTEGRGVASGVYTVILEADGTRQARRITLVK